MVAPPHQIKKWQEIFKSRRLTVGSGQSIACCLLLTY